MWTLLEKKEADKLTQLLADSCDKLQAAIRGHEISQEELAEMNSRKYIEKIKDADKKVKIDTIPVVEAIASLNFILDRIENKFVSKHF